MGDGKNGSTNNLPNGTPNENGDDTKEESTSRRFGAFRDRAPKWVSGVGGGFLGGLTTILFLIIPVVNTWISNAKEISLAQVKNSAEQISYVTQRMQDSDKERDLYKSEMLNYQKEARELADKLHACERVKQ